jgi:hypothetical protein
MAEQGTPLTNGSYPVSVNVGISHWTVRFKGSYLLLYQPDNRNLNSLLLKRHKPMHDFGLLSCICIDNVGQQPREFA